MQITKTKKTLIKYESKGYLVIVRILKQLKQIRGHILEQPLHLNHYFGTKFVPKFLNDETSKIWHKVCSKIYE